MFSCRLEKRFCARTRKYRDVVIALGNWGDLNFDVYFRRTTSVVILPDRGLRYQNRSLRKLWSLARWRPSWSLWRPSAVTRNSTMSPDSSLIWTGQSANEGALPNANWLKTISHKSQIYVPSFVLNGDARETTERCRAVSLGSSDRIIRAAWIHQLGISVITSTWRPA